MSLVHSLVIALGGGSMLVVWHGFVRPDVAIPDPLAGPKHGKNGLTTVRYESYQVVLA
jgi:hypothetical protein